MTSAEPTEAPKGEASAPIPSAPPAPEASAPPAPAPAPTEPPAAASTPVSEQPPSPPPLPAPPVEEDAPSAETPAPASPSRKRSRRASAKSAAASAPRALRPRSSARSSGDEIDLVEPDVQPAETNFFHIPKRTPSDPKNEPTREEVDPRDMDTPRPIQTDRGLTMTVGDTVFVTFDQLEPVKQQRMRGKGLKPIEELTFQDILTYNRDQLRCYCYIYSTPRKKKSEMEVDMARFVSLWNEGSPGFVFSEYVPKNAGKVEISQLPSARPADDADRPDTDGVLRQSRRASTPSGKIGSAGTTPGKLEPGSVGDQESPAVAGGGSTSVRAASTPAKPPAKATPKSSSKTPAKNLARTPVRAPASAMPTASAKRPPPRPANIQPSPIRPNLPPRPPSSERSVAPGRASSSALLPNNAPVPIQAAGSASGRNSSGSSSKTAKPAMPVQAMPKGFGTSHKQKVHARTAGAKFKAAYNGAGPAIVNIVENAAAYFEGKDSPEVVLDRAKSYERYQFNVDLLSEIFDGPLPEEVEETQDDDVTMKDVDANDPKAAVTRELAMRMRSRTSSGIASEMKVWEENYRKLDNLTKESERANMRLFQRLERAEKEEEIDAVKRDFEREHNIRLPCAPPPLVRRKLDKSLAPVLMPDDKCRILRFKVA